MRNTLHAAFSYFAIVFSAGFALGVARTLIAAPWVGETTSVALELPVMLTVSWFASRFVISGHAVAPRFALRLSVGWLAFALLMAGEVALSMLVMGRSLVEHAAAYRTPAATLGLLAQIAFAMFPTVQFLRAAAIDPSKSPRSP